MAFLFSDLVIFGGFCMSALHSIYKRRAKACDMPVMMPFRLIPHTPLALALKVNCNFLHGVFGLILSLIIEPDCQRPALYPYPTPKRLGCQVSYPQVVLHPKRGILKE